MVMPDISFDMGIITEGTTTSTPSRPATQLGRADVERLAEAHARAARGDGDLVGVELAAAIDDGVDLVGHRPEHHQGPDADGDAEDGQRGAEPSPPQVA